MKNFYKMLASDEQLKKKCVGGIYKDNVPNAIAYPSLLVHNALITPVMWADNVAIQYEQYVQVTLFLRNNDDKGLGETIKNIMTAGGALFRKAEWLRDDNYGEYYLFLEFVYYTNGKEE